MTISYPLTLPSDRFRSVRIVARDVVSMAESPFTLSQDVQQFGGQRWEMDVVYRPFRRAEAAADVIAFLLSCKGRLGTFLAAVDPLSNAPRGTWAGSPLVMGAHAAGAATLAVDGFSGGATVKAGDYLQTGSGASSRLYQVLQDATAGGGLITLDIWPNLRAAVADNAAIVTVNPKCVWRLASNERSWDIGLSQQYGLHFTAVESLN